MRNVLGNFRKNPLISLYILVLAAVTIGISVLAVLKTGSGTVLTENKTAKQSWADLSPAATGTPSQEANSSVSDSPVASENRGSVDLAGACIVTLFGNRYDVTKLRSSHPGGDVFACGTDQTELYRSQHGTNLNQMKRYLIDGQGNAPDSSASSFPGRANSHEEREDDD